MKKPRLQSEPRGRMSSSSTSRCSARDWSSTEETQRRVWLQTALRVPKKRRSRSRLLGEPSKKLHVIEYQTTPDPLPCRLQEVRNGEQQRNQHVLRRLRREDIVHKHKTTLQASPIDPLDRIDLSRHMHGSFERRERVQTIHQSPMPSRVLWMMTYLLHPVRL